MAENTTKLALLLKEVPRALDELRRAQPLVLGFERSNLLIFPTEFVSDAVLAELRQLCSTPPYLLISGTRAQHLGLSKAGQPLTLALAEAPEVVWRDYALNPSPSGLTAEAAPASGLQQQALSLLKLAGLLPAAIVCALPEMGETELAEFLHHHNLMYLPAPMVAVYREQLAVRLSMSEPVALPLKAVQDARLIAFRAEDSGVTHLAVIMGKPEATPLVRVHSSCLTGDILGSLRCDCGDQLALAMAQIAAAGDGVLLYLNQEGRGVGLANKLRAYALQEQGFDTVDANERLGYEADERDFRIAASMLKLLEFDTIVLLSNNPAKEEQLTQAGIRVVERRTLSAPSHLHNESYLKTKAARLHHQF